MTQLPARIVRTHLAVFSLAAPLSAILTYILLSWLGGMDPHSGWTGKALLFSVSLSLSSMLTSSRSILNLLCTGRNVPLRSDVTITDINTRSPGRINCERVRCRAYAVGQVGPYFSGDARPCFTSGARWAWTRSLRLELIPFSR